MPKRACRLLAAPLAVVVLIAPLAATQTATPLHLREAGLVIDFDFTYGRLDRPYVVDAGGAGAGWLDFDQDGRLDLLLLNGLPGPSESPAQATMAASAGRPLPQSSRPDGSVPAHQLLRGGDTGLSRSPAAAGLAESAWSSAVAVADIDNDGYDEIYVTAIGPNRLYRNNGDGSFTVTDAGIEHPGYGTGAAFFDWDLDGNLDLYLVNYVEFDASTIATIGDGVCHYLGVEVFCGPAGLAGEQDRLYRGTGAGSFVIWPGLGVDPENGFGFAALPFDCDGDGRLEIYVANDSNMNLLYSLVDEALDDRSLFSGAGFGGGGLEQAGMGVTSADYDSDGDFDLVVANFQRDYDTLYENVGECSFVDVTADRGLAAATYPYMGWGVLFLDIDGDADRDLFVANGHLYPQVDSLEAFAQPDLLFINRLRESGRAAFEAAPATAGSELGIPRTSRSAVAGDWDNDGDTDLLVTHLDSPPRLLINDGRPRFPALQITLVGRTANRDAYGARVAVVSGGLRQVLELRHGDGYLGSNDTRLLVFLPGERAESVTVHWPSGETESLGAVPPGRYVVKQGSGTVAAVPW